MGRPQAGRIRLAVASVVVVAASAGFAPQSGAGSARASGEETLAEHITRVVSEAVAGRAPETAMRLFVTQDHAAGVFERNPDSWVTAAVDTATCLSPSNSRGANRRAGTLVTPRHVILAEHYRLFAGDKIVFVADDNTVHERTITAAIGHPDYEYYYPDLRVLALDRDLPAAVTPCKVASPELASMLDGSLPVPAVALNQLEEAMINTLTSLNSYAIYSRPSDPALALYYKDVVGGDSGNPSLLTVDGELVLMTVWSSGGSGAGASIARFTDDLNDMIAAVDAEAGAPTGYTVQFPDLSPFGGVVQPTPTPTPEPTPPDHGGDVDCDDAIGIRDPFLVARLLAGEIGSSPSCPDPQTGGLYGPAADVDRDEAIGESDIVVLLDCLAGSPCPAGLATDS